MQVETELKPPFHYALWPIFLLIAIIIILCIILRSKPKPKQEPVKIELNVPKRKTVSTIKQESLAKIGKIKKEYTDKKIDERACCQQLSVIVRKFVHDMTGVEVQKYTLRDLKTLNMPELYDLVKSCYRPEFAKDPKEDVQDSLEMAREIIEKWN